MKREYKWEIIKMGAMDVVAVINPTSQQIVKVMVVEDVVVGAVAAKVRKRPKVNLW